MPLSSCSEKSKSDIINSSGLSSSIMRLAPRFSYPGRVWVEIDSRLIADKFTQTVHRHPGSREIIEYNREFIDIQRLVSIGYVSMDHMEQVIQFINHNAVPVCMTFCFDESDTIPRCAECAASSGLTSCALHSQAGRLHVSCDLYLIK